MKHSGSRYNDYPSLRRRGLNPTIRQVAIIQTWRTSYGPKGEETPHFTIELHGAEKVMVKKVIDPWRGTLYMDYTLEWEPVGDRLNGKCHRTLVLMIDKPDLHCLGVGQWVSFIKSRLEHLFLCRVTVYDDYIRFLND